MAYQHSLLKTALLSVPFFAFVGTAWAGIFNPQQFELENGLEIVVIEDHRAPVVTHMVWFRAGAADEEARQSGIAHLLEHLVFKATDKVPLGEFSKIIARNGGQDNAFTSYDYTGYYQNLARDKLGLVMELFADRMVNLRLTETDIETERQVVIEERNSRVDNRPSAQFGEHTRAALFLSHPYGRPLIGWRHDIDALTLGDAVDWYKRHYAPNNAVLVVAGDVTGAEVLALAKKHYGPLARRAVPRRVRALEPPHRAERRVLFEHERITQASLRRSYLAPSRNRGEIRFAIPLQVLDQLFGTGATSRLYRDLVVERKIAVSAGSSYSGSAYDLSSFTLYGTPSSGVELKALEDAIDEVIAKLLSDGVTAVELKRAKFSLRAAAVFARDNMFTGARIFGSALMAGLSVAQVEAWPDDVAKVTAEDVMAAARHVFNRKRSVTGWMMPAPKTDQGG